MIKVVFVGKFACQTNKSWKWTVKYVAKQRDIFFCFSKTQWKQTITERKLKSKLNFIGKEKKCKR